MKDTILILAHGATLDTYYTVPDNVSLYKNANYCTLYASAASMWKRVFNAVSPSQLMEALDVDESIDYGVRQPGDSDNDMKLTFRNKPDDSFKLGVFMARDDDVIIQKNKWWKRISDRGSMVNEYFIDYTPFLNINTTLGEVVEQLSLMNVEQQHIQIVLVACTQPAVEPHLLPSISSPVKTLSTSTGMSLKHRGYDVLVDENAHTLIGNNNQLIMYINIISDEKTTIYILPEPHQYNTSPPAYILSSFVRWFMKNHAYAELDEATVFWLDTTGIVPSEYESASYEDDNRVKALFRDIPFVINGVYIKQYSQLQYERHSSSTWVPTSGTPLVCSPNKRELKSWCDYNGSCYAYVINSADASKNCAYASGETMYDANSTTYHKKRRTFR